MYVCVRAFRSRTKIKLASWHLVMCTVVVILTKVLIRQSPVKLRENLIALVVETKQTRMRSGKTPTG